MRNSPRLSAEYPPNMYPDHQESRKGLANRGSDFIVVPSPDPFILPARESRASRLQRRYATAIIQVHQAEQALQRRRLQLDDEIRLPGFAPQRLVQRIQDAPVPEDAGGGIRIE